MPQLFLDLDGVLADFEAGYRSAFGLECSVALDNTNWDLVRSRPGFYRGLPPTPDMRELWGHVSRHRPIILTGLPWSVEGCEADKRAWVEEHLGPDVEVRCCPSRHKYLQAAPGDILVDDWEKYRDLWLGAGGRWVTHTSAASSVAQLERLGITR